jgi:glutathione S-transferase
MKLLYNPISPFARMCVITAREVGLRSLDIVAVEGLSVISANAEVARHNPLGRIPTLITDHGHPMHDSRVICEYIAHRAGNKSVLPDEPVKRFRILTLQALGQGMADTAVALRYETASRPEALRWRELIDRNRQRLTAACKDLEEHWITELKEVTLGSIAVAATLAYVDFRHGNLGWRDNNQRLSDWFGRFSARPSMAPVAA